MADEPERPQDPRVRVAEFLARFGRERNLNLPPLGDDGVGIDPARLGGRDDPRAAPRRACCCCCRGSRSNPSSTRRSARRLLALSFVETGDAAFALHPQTGDLYLRILRGLDGLDYEEFEDIVHSIAKTADHWDDKLAAELA